MNWIKLSIWIQRFFFCAGTTTVAGSVLVILLLLMGHFSKWKDSRLRLPWIKTALILYLVPIAILLIFIPRVDFAIHGIVWFSEFWHVSSPPMQKKYLIAACIWIFGLMAGSVFHIVQYWKLKDILKGNVPIEDKNCQKLICEYKEKYRLNHVEIYQNDLISFPVSVGSFQPQVVLPMKAYVEKELHMILEHEMNHIKNHDLTWKKIGLLVTFIHWWNPLTYLLLEKLILQEEIECDIRTCESNSHFTKKEYCLYLSGMEESNDDMIFTSALCKSKKDLLRRLEGMVKGKKYKKRTVVISCLVLSLLAVIPSYAASEGMARFQEKWISETEVATEEELIDYKALEQTSHVSEESDVEEIDLSLEDEPVSMTAEVTLDRTIHSNTRVLYRWQEMKKGDQIVIVAKCSDSSIVYRIGIKDSKDNLTQVEGSGNLSHIFTSESDGKYTVYVENRSSKSMQVTGWARYPD